MISSTAKVYAEILIKEGEGYASEIYECTKGFSTIGYGHRVKQQEIGKLTQVTSEQAE